MRGALARVAVAVTTMVALAFLIPLAMLVHQQARATVVSQAQRRAAAVGPILAVTSDPAQIQAALPDEPRGRIGVRLPDGTVVGTVRASPAQLDDVRDSGEVRVPGGSVVLQPVVLADRGVAVVEADVVGYDRSDLLRTWAILVGVAVTLVTTSALVADRLAARLLSGVDELASSARALGAGDLSARPMIPGPYELGEVGEAFDTMADQIRALVESEREFAAEISHRLRTPLTALRLETARLPDSEGADQVRRAVAAMEQEVDDVILSARSGRRRADQQWCDAVEQVRARMSFWTALGTGQGRDVQADLVSVPAPVPMTAADLVSVVDALVGNVFRHTPSRTPLRVTLAASRGRVILLVEDAGPGIRSAAAEPQDPQRPARRGSTGLGLDIVRRHVEKIGGQLEVSRSPMGGASVRLSIPDLPAWRNRGTTYRRSRRSARQLWPRAG